MDEEIAQLFCASMDMASVQKLLAAIHQTILETCPDVSTQTVVYTMTCMLANAMIPRKEMSVAFRFKVLAGLGDLAGAMMHAGLAVGMGGDEADRAIPDPPPRRVKTAELGPAPVGGTDLYNVLVDDDADVYTLEEFQGMIEDGALTDEDGHGAFAIKDEPDCYYMDQTFKVSPGDFEDHKNKRGATHVVWFNK